MKKLKKYINKYEKNRSQKRKKEEKEAIKLKKIGGKGRKKKK